MRVIIDIEVKQNYQAKPDRQEWIMIMDCIYANGISIPSMIIFKDVNICNYWLSKELSEK